LTRFGSPVISQARTAAERVASRRAKRHDDQAAAVACLKTKQEGIGSAPLAKKLNVDAANLGR
jgi:hypothetical protein